MGKAARLHAVSAAEKPVKAGIELTLGECLKAEQALTQLAQQQTTAKVAYRLAKWRRLITAETAHFHEQREAAIRELGTAQPDGTMAVMPGSEHWPAFLERMNAHTSVPVTITYEPLTMAELDTLTSLSADDLMNLGPCFTDE